MLHQQQIRFAHLRAAYMRLVVHGGLDKTFISKSIWHAAISDQVVCESCTDETISQDEDEQILETEITLKTKEIFIMICLMKIATYRSAIANHSKSELEKIVNDAFSLECAAILSKIVCSILERVHGEKFRDAKLFKTIFDSCEQSSFLYVLEMFQEKFAQNNPSILEKLNKILNNESFEN